MVHPQLIATKGQPVGAGSAGVAEVNRLMQRQEGTIATVSTAPAALKAERYEPKIFGFRVNEEARLSRWRTAKRDE